MAGLDPAIAEFVRRVTDAWAAYPDLERRPLAEQRAAAEAVRAPWREGGPALPRRDIVAPTAAGDVRLRLYGALDPQARRPVMLYAHGGGFSNFSLDTHDRILREYAAGAGIVVAGVDYALSPEAKHPVALEQMIAAAHWAATEGAAVGLDAERIALGGDSAGANLALAAAIALRDAGELDVVRALLLAYGFFDDDLTYRSNHRFGQPGALLSNDELAGYIDNYVGGTPLRSSPLAFPAKARMDGLPPSFHLIAACDPLADSDRAVAAKMQAAGCVVDARVYEGASHSFLEAVAIAPLAARALAESAGWLAQQLGGR